MGGSWSLCTSRYSVSSAPSKSGHHAESKVGGEADQDAASTTNGALPRGAGGCAARARRLAAGRIASNTMASPRPLSSALASAAAAGVPAASSAGPPAPVVGVSQVVSQKNAISATANTPQPNQ